MDIRRYLKHWQSSLCVCSVNGHRRLIDVEPVFLVFSEIPFISLDWDQISEQLFSIHNWVPTTYSKLLISIQLFSLDKKQLHLDILSQFHQLRIRVLHYEYRVCLLLFNSFSQINRVLLCHVQPIPPYLTINLITTQFDFTEDHYHHCST